MDSSRLTLDDLIDKERACGVLHGPFWRQKYLDRAPERVRRGLELASRFPEIRAARDAFDTPVQQEFPNFSGIAAVTSGTEINLWNPALWTPIAANDAAPGCGYIVSFGGIYGNRTTSSPTSLWTARWGTNNSSPPTGTSLGASNAVYMGAASTAKPFFGEVEVTIRTVGTSGTCAMNGIVFACSDTVATKTGWVLGGTATIDTTAAAGISISHTWGATNASNTLTCQWAYLRAVN